MYHFLTTTLQEKAKQEAKEKKVTIYISTSISVIADLFSLTCKKAFNTTHLLVHTGLTIACLFVVKYINNIK